MSGSPQWPQNQAGNQTYWSHAEKCWKNSNGQRFDPHSKQWIPPANEHVYNRNQEQQRSLQNVPRTPQSDFRSDSTGRAVTSTPSVTAAHAPHQRSLSFSSGGSGQYTLQPPYNARVGYTAGVGVPAQPVEPFRTGPPQVSPRPVHRDIQGTDGNYDEFDARYKKRPKDFFKKFRVFMMLWAQPCEDWNSTGMVTQKEPWSRDLANHLSREYVRDSRFGQYIHSKIRRFIVVKEGADKCLCVPIVTYGGQGAGKNGVIKSEHCIVYTGRTVPNATEAEQPGRGEKPMRTEIHVRTDERGDKLEEMSRIDYGRVYTVEKNVKARAFGWVDEHDQKDLEYDFLSVFMGEEGYSAWREQNRRRDRNAGVDSEEGEGDDDDDDDESDDGDEEASEDEASDIKTRAATNLSNAKGKAPMRESRITETQIGGAKLSSGNAQSASQHTVPTAARHTLNFDTQPQQPYRRNLPILTRGQAPQRHSTYSQPRVHARESEDESP